MDRYELSMVSCYISIRVDYFAVKYTHTHPFHGPLSGTTRVSQYQIGETNMGFTEARDSE